jgi:hypothetical protein
MAEYDGGFKIAARSSGVGLSRLAGIHPEAWEPIGDTLQTTERLADRAFRAKSGGTRFVVYMEAYVRWVESATWSVLSKSGLLSERERLPTRSLIFILLPKGYREQKGTFRLRAELLTTLGIFGMLADKSLDILSIIRREDMHESPLALEFVLEGEQIRARKAVLQAIELRFGEKQSKEFTAALERITNLDRLEELLKQAIKARRLSQFRRMIAGT